MDRFAEGGSGRFGAFAAVLAAILGVLTSPAAVAAEGWRTYRSEEAGYAISFPPGLEMRASSGETSATLVEAASGERVLELELWPPGLCPREPPGTTARALGTERAVAVTQTDGPAGSSVCGETSRVHEGTSSHGVRHWELWLACDGGDHKGPTFFADVSQSWRTRALLLDPVGVDTRQAAPRRPVDAALLRRILATLATFEVPRPSGTCIEELR